MNPDERNETRDDPLAGLLEFQRRTALHAFKKLYDKQATSRFLVADEVGLGKTLVAKAVLGQALATLDGGDDSAFTAIYICSNASIAAQNLKKLGKAIRGGHEQLNTRLSLLAIRNAGNEAKDVKLLSMTPGTSLRFNDRTLGLARERALLFRLLMEMNEPDIFKPDEGSLRRILQGNARKNWDGYITEIERQDIHTGIKQEFYARIREQRNKTWFKNFRDAAETKTDKTDETEKTGEIIGKLRYFLASASLKSLKPHLLILDEFQRFSDLLQDNETNEDTTGRLARELFDGSEKPDGDIKILLLSATPYKMYSMNHENDGDHYTDFFNTLLFLYGGNEKSTEELKNLFHDYRKSLLGSGSPDDETPFDVRKKEILEHKEKIQERLLQVMSRTERVGNDKNAMLQQKRREFDFKPIDLLAARFLVDVARRVEARGVLEYWRSIPYPLNFMRDYELGKLLAAVLDDKSNLPPNTKADLAALFTRNKELLLSPERLESFTPLEISHPKLRALLEDVVDSELNGDKIGNSNENRDIILSGDQYFRGEKTA